jgi:tRNA(Ile)-lysidine synthase
VRGSSGSSAAASPADGLGSRSALATFVPRLTALGVGEDRVVVGCSGGADSLALLALVRASEREACAVYVDHGLRPGVHDADVVAAAAARFGAAFRAVRVDIAVGGNLEARARDARYAALEAVRAEQQAAAVLVGHTRDDQAETVLLNLLRGSGTSGLAGMPRRRGHLRRPLLGFRRAETREICARLGLAPVQDLMNDDVRYRRVWLRREVIPQLERDARRDLVEVLARQADLVRDDSEYLDARAAALLGPDDVQDAARLAAAPAALARRAVRTWLGSPPLPSGQVEAVLEVARGERRAVQLPGDRRVERVAGALHLVATPAAVPARATLALPGRAQFGRFDLDAWFEHAPPVRWPDGREAAVLDADRVGAAVTIAATPAGARFRPLGRSGTKLVSDALREAGVASTERAARPVVIGPAGNVCWVVGYRIDESVKVTARTRRFLWIAAEASPPNASARA